MLFNSYKTSVLFVWIPRVHLWLGEKGIPWTWKRWAYAWCFSNKTFSKRPQNTQWGAWKIECTWTSVSFLQGALKMFAFSECFHCFLPFNCGVECQSVSTNAFASDIFSRRGTFRDICSRVFVSLPALASSLDGTKKRPLSGARFLLEIIASLPHVDWPKLCLHIFIL